MDGRRLRSATLCRASLRYGGERVNGRVLGATPRSQRRNK